MRTAPSPQAPSAGHLRLLTIDQQAELYMALTSAHTPSGESWIQVELPGRPNGRTGWVPRGALGPAARRLRPPASSTAQRLRATLFRGGRTIFSAPVGVGKASTITPPGNFYVMEKLRAINGADLRAVRARHERLRADAQRMAGRRHRRHPRHRRTALIPGRPSHGCIRMRNADITRLWAIVGVGTPIEITADPTGAPRDAGAAANCDRHGGVSPSSRLWIRCSETWI